jgi:hypothetical protein
MPNTESRNTAGHRPARLHFVGLFQTNKAMLILCIGIAFVLWLSTKMNKIYQTTLPIRVEYKLPKSKTFRVPPTETIDADIRATGWELLSQYFNATIQHIDLPITSSTKVIDNRILRKNISNILPIEVELLRFSPENIIVELSAQSIKKVPLIAPIQASSAQAYQLLKPIRLTPDSIEIIGPESEISKIKLWITDSLTLNTLLETPKGSIAVSKHGNKSIKFGLEQVRYETELEQLTQKNVDLEIKVINATDSIQLFPRKITVVCTVGLSRYDDVEDNMLQAVVDVKGVNLRKASTLPIKITQKPAWLNVQQILPSPRTDFIIVKKVK